MVPRKSPTVPKSEADAPLRRTLNCPKRASKNPTRPIGVFLLVCWFVGFFLFLSFPSALAAACLRFAIPHQPSITALVSPSLSLASLAPLFPFRAARAAAMRAGPARRGGHPPSFPLWLACVRGSVPAWGRTPLNQSLFLSIPFFIRFFLFSTWLFLTFSPSPEAAVESGPGPLHYHHTHAHHVSVFPPL